MNDDISSMTNPLLTESEATEEISVLQLWQNAVGKVFKIGAKIYGMRTVTYTQVKGVRQTGEDGRFEIEVLCVEITSRVLSGKRTHSNICKEGVMPQEAGSELRPDSFGDECSRLEFEKLTGAILAYTNTYLDWVMQPAPEEKTEIEVPIDLPHLKLTDMEASLVRNSPFLLQDLYFLTPNSIRAALASIQQELQRASRNMLLGDAADPLYVERKNEATASLHAKLKAAQIAAAAVRKDTAQAMLELDSLSLALLGKASATTVVWVTANPSEEGPVANFGTVSTPLDFVRWAHTSGRLVPDEIAATRDLRAYFRGYNDSYTGPDKDGVFPLMKPATE
jgi:hypothetical protein